MAWDEYNICKKNRSSYFQDNDLFGQLHPDLLMIVLSFLPFKDAVRSSILAKNWRDLWKNSDNVKFNFIEVNHQGPAISACYQFDEFLLKIPRKKIIKNIDVRVRHCLMLNESLFKKWLIWAVEHQVEKLVMKINKNSKMFYTLPEIFCECKTLVQLKISTFCLHNVSNNSQISWPLLKDLSFINVKMSAVNFNIVIRNCPLLERLSLVNCKFSNSTEHQRSKLMFCSPTLRYLKLWNCYHRDISITVELPSLVELSCNMSLSNFTTEQRALLAAASSLKSLIVGDLCLRAFSMGSISGSTTVTHVKVNLTFDDKRYIKGMANLINYCSNLQTLVIHFEKEPSYVDRDAIFLMMDRAFDSCVKILEDNLSTNRLHLKTMLVHGIYMNELIHFTDLSWAESFVLVSNPF